MLDVTRVEKKYNLNISEAERIKTALNRVMTSDPHNGENGYLVRSLYFDSLYNKDYFAKTDGVDVRKKIRLRIYSPEDETAKLEVKEKAGGMQRKRSLSLTKDEAKRIIEGDFSCLLKWNDALGEALYCLMTKEIYRPKCIVEYDRYAFVHEDNNIRVTFDSNIRAGSGMSNLFSKEPMYYPIAKSGDITLEVKYDRFLHSNIKAAIGDNLSLNLSSSKYCRAREGIGY
ncbi:MAG: polyphosphate polymerase domain-containing protein [Lachnospiraceae bacterium]|nr:polyphosphate polymerase domain-containing protein [Lachnospiraceae bacterium]